MWVISQTLWIETQTLPLSGRVKFWSTWRRKKTTNPRKVLKKSVKSKRRAQKMKRTRRHPLWIGRSRPKKHNTSTKKTMKLWSKSARVLPCLSQIQNTKSKLSSRKTNGQLRFPRRRRANMCDGAIAVKKSKDGSYQKIRTQFLQQKTRIWLCAMNSGYMCILSIQMNTQFASGMVFSVSLWTWTLSGAGCRWNLTRHITMIYRTTRLVWLVSRFQWLV